MTPKRSDHHDVATPVERFGYDRHLELAAEKNAGFTTEAFADSVSTIRRLTNADWTEDSVEPESVSAFTPLFEHWNTELRSTAPPQSRINCLD